VSDQPDESPPDDNQDQYPVSLRDVVGLIGLILIGVGVYGAFGPYPASMAIGVIMLFVALFGRKLCGK